MADPQLLPGYHIENISIEGDSLLIANAREGLFVFNLPGQGGAAEKKVIVYNTPETPTVAVAEFTLSLILNLIKKSWGRPLYWEFYAYYLCNGNFDDRNGFKYLSNGGDYV